MSDADRPIQLTSMASAAERMFPTLKPEQIERVAAHGRIRQVQDGEILVEAGAQNTRFFIVRTGRLEIVRPPGTDELIVAGLGPGQFTGETSMLAGRRAMAWSKACLPRAGGSRPWGRSSTRRRKRPSPRAGPLTSLSTRRLPRANR